MRILFLTNFFPPLAYGGYEQWCQEVALGLRQRGHEVAVLTSRFGLPRLQEKEPDWIRRTIHLEMALYSLGNVPRFFVGRQRRERENEAELRQMINDFAPDRVLVWGMWNMPKGVAALAEKLLPGRVVYYLGDYWPTLPHQYVNYWQAPVRNPLARLPKRWLGKVALRMMAQEDVPQLAFEHGLFCSTFLRDELQREGVSFQQSQVIYGAVDTALFADCGCELGEKRVDERLTLLYAGRLHKDKGVHTAVDAVAHLVNHCGISNVELQIVGNGFSDYVGRLHRMVQEKQMERYVSFLGSRAKEDMPGMYRQADIFLFMSVWPEPFGRVLVEAMAAGLTVVGTATGGAAEVLVDGETGLTFEPENGVALAEQIARLHESPQLRERLVTNGRRIALQNFDIGRMVTEIETYLLNVAA